MSQQQYIDVLNSFLQDKPIKRRAKQLFQVIEELCSLKAQISFNLTGSHRCCFCKKKGKTRMLNCKHLVHPQCMKRVALENSATMDPSQLLSIQCSQCHQLVGYERIVGIIGKEEVDQLQTQASRKIGLQILRQQAERRKKQIEDLRIECQICQQDFKINDVITLNCQSEPPHRYCKECTTRQIKAVIDQGKFSAKDLCCRQCKTPIDQQIIKQCISKQDFNRLMDLRYRKMQVEGLQIRQCIGYRYRGGRRLMEQQMNLPEKQHNKFQDQLQRRCQALRAGLRPPEVQEDVEECTAMISFDAGADEVGFIRCPACGLETCNRGCQSAHRGNTCQKFRQWKQLSEQSDQKADEVIRSAGMQRCSRCRNVILKQVGCQHITCRCGHQFCYICGADWAGHRICRR